MKTILFLSLIALVVVANFVIKPLQSESLTTQTLQKDTCDNPDADIRCCFVNIPSSLTATMAISAPNEPGEKLEISGKVFKSDGKTPYPGVVIYAYQTDHTGHYSKKGNETGFQKWHGYLHGWCKTDAGGNYTIQTIRPARYPDNSMPAHIHAALRQPDSKSIYYISDFVFRDDNLVNSKYLSTVASLVGGTGVVDLSRSSAGTWTGKRNIILTK
jgi:protocatechuate 3,4-dioxygenase, beta subunit